MSGGIPGSESSNTTTSGSSQAAMFGGSPDPFNEEKKETTTGDTIKNNPYFNTGNTPPPLEEEAPVEQTPKIRYTRDIEQKFVKQNGGHLLHFIKTLLLSKDNTDTTIVPPESIEYLSFHNETNNFSLGFNEQNGHTMMLEVIFKPFMEDFIIKKTGNNNNIQLLLSGMTENDTRSVAILTDISMNINSKNILSFPDYYLWILAALCVKKYQMYFVFEDPSKKDKRNQKSHLHKMHMESLCDALVFFAVSLSFNKYDEKVFKAMEFIATKIADRYFNGGDYSVIHDERLDLLYQELTEIQKLFEGDQEKHRMELFLQKGMQPWTGEITTLQTDHCMIAQSITTLKKMLITV